VEIMEILRAAWTMLGTIASDPLLWKTSGVGAALGLILAFFAIRDIRRAERAGAARRRELQERKAEHE
jgi:hypothetical protein